MLHVAAFFGHEACSIDGDTLLTLDQRKRPANVALLVVLSGRGSAVLPGTSCDRCGATSGFSGRPLGRDLERLLLGALLQ